MPLIISDDVLRASGLTEREMRIERDCSLFDAEKLYLWHAAELCGLDRMAFINELQKRDIPVFRPSVEDVEHDFEILDRIGPRK